MSDYGRSPPLDQGIGGLCGASGQCTGEGWRRMLFLRMSPVAVSNSFFLLRESGNLKFNVHLFYFILRHGLTM